MTQLAKCSVKLPIHTRHGCRLRLFIPSPRLLLQTGLRMPYSLWLGAGIPTSHHFGWAHGLLCLSVFRQMGSELARVARLIGNIPRLP